MRQIPLTDGGPIAEHNIINFALLALSYGVRTCDIGKMVGRQIINEGKEGRVPYQQLRMAERCCAEAAVKYSVLAANRRKRNV